MKDNRIEMILQGDEFTGLQNGDDISAWFKPEQNGLTFYVANSSPNNKVLRKSGILFIRSRSVKRI